MVRGSPARRPAGRAIGVALLVAACAGAPQASTPPDAPPRLEDELGRSETRVRSEAYPIVAGMTLEGSGLVERLERLGYLRVHERPEVPGRYFWGHTRLWIYLRGFRVDGGDRDAALVGLVVERGRVVGAVDGHDRPVPLDRPDAPRLEPETLAESLDGDRALRVPVRLDALPERVWRPVLAAEDARFFEHVGVDGRSLARAVLANLQAGGVAQGGSTITQQLIKNRDLTPKRSLGRKASEAVRALALEADYDKREILQAYLDQVYLGHVDGLAIHGLGTAAEAYFSKPAADLELDEAAALAAMIQGPNRLSPMRHADRLRERRDWVLDRMTELGWAGPAEAERARARPIRLRTTPPKAPAARQLLDWVGRRVEAEEGERLARGRGVVVETTLDPLLQDDAERIVAEHLRGLRGSHPELRGAGLSAALVALDPRDGSVLAYVGGDPDARDDRFDRARLARRQPGSAIKPLLLLEAFQSCGRHEPLHPASRVADEPLTVELPTGAWRPTNFDDRFHGVVDLRTALVRSYNVPFVRIARWCGEERTADRLRRAGLVLPDPPPPSFALGAVEVSPLQMASAYTIFATPGERSEPRPIRRIEKPGGRGLDTPAPRRRDVVHPSSAWLVRDLMREAVERGTGQAAALSGVAVAGKTGSSSSLRDAWFVGDTGNVVAAVWIGLDGDGALGRTGGQAAAPLWHDFMERAAQRRPPRTVARPPSVVRGRVDPDTGLLVGPRSRRGEETWFRQGAMPDRKRIWRPGEREPVVR